MTYRTRQHCLIEFYRASRIVLRRMNWKKIKRAISEQSYYGVRIVRGKSY